MRFSFSPLKILFFRDRTIEILIPLREIEFETLQGHVVNPKITIAVPKTPRAAKESVYYRKFFSATIIFFKLYTDTQVPKWGILACSVSLHQLEVGSHVY